MKEEELRRGCCVTDAGDQVELTQIQQYIRFWVVCVLLMVTDEFLWLSFI